MWLFTQYGFFSAVCARQGDGGHDQPVVPGRIMVRARRREQIERLTLRFADLLGGVEVHDSIGTDYRFRIFVDKSIWAEVVRQLTVEIGYDNFKSAAANKLAGQDDADVYGRALHDV